MEKLAKTTQWLANNCRFALDDVTAGELDPAVKSTGETALAELNRMGQADPQIIRSLVDKALNAYLRINPALQPRKNLMAVLVEQYVADRFVPKTAKQPVPKPPVPKPQRPAPNTPDWRSRTPEEQSFVEKRRTLKPFAR